MSACCKKLLDVEVDSFGQVPLRDVPNVLKWVVSGRPTKKDVKFRTSDEYRNNLKRGDHISFKVKKINPWCGTTELLS